MSVNRLTQLLVLSVCILLLPGCAKKASEEIDFGAFEKSVYRNNYFGFNLKLPPDWSVQDQEMRQRLAEVGTKMLVGDDRQMKAILKASEQQTVNLLAAFKHPVGHPVPFNPNVICMAERLRGFSGIKSGKDYHYHTRKLMESSNIKVDLAKELTVEKLGGIDFDVMHGSITIGKVTVHQKYYAAIMKDYALVFITSFSAPDQQTTLQNILQTLSFKQSTRSRETSDTNRPPANEVTSL